MFLELSDLRDEDHLSFSAKVTTEDGDIIDGRHSFYKGHYDDHIQFDKDRLALAQKKVITKSLVLSQPQDLGRSLSKILMA